MEGLSMLRTYALLLIVAFNSSYANAPLSSPNDDQLRVGVSSLNIEPQVGIPLAGYGSKERRLPEFMDWRRRFPHSFFFRPSEGTHTPIRSKAMVLRKGDRNLIFVSLDMIGLEHRFIKDVADRLAPLGVDEQDIVMSATHTHSGPGTLTRRIPLALIAVDIFKRENYEYVLAKVVQNIHVALFLAEPAELLTSSFVAEGFQKNKFRRKDEEHYNKKASFLLARSLADGRNMGGLVNFAVHGGGMPIEHLHYSSDFPGQIEINIENNLARKNTETLGDRANYVDRPTMLFMNGAEGDVATPGRGIELIEQLGVEFARQAEGALNDLRPVEPEFSVARKKVWLGIASSPLRYCIGDGSKRKYKQIPLRFPLGALFPNSAYVSAVRIGNITMLTWPGEPSTTLGYRLQGVATQEGFDDSWVLGLVNDYMTYFTTKEEYHEAQYDSCSSLFNWRGGDRILDAHRALLKDLKKTL